MTNPDQLRIDVCKAIGWRVVERFQGVMLYDIYRPDNTRAFIDYRIRYDILPPLTLDLMHQAEETLQGHERTRYALALAEIATKDGDMGWDVAHATVEQRAKAFLMVKGGE